MDINDEIRQMHNEDPPSQICLEISTNPNKMIQIADIITQVIEHYKPLVVDMPEIRKAIEFGLSTIDAFEGDL